MSKQNRPPKKIFKFLAIGCVAMAGIVVTFIIGSWLLVGFLLSDGDSFEENKQRQEAVIHLKNTIEQYHATHHEYPSAKIIFELEGENVQEYLSSNVIRYHKRKDSMGKECYVLQYIHAGTLGWNGTQYSNSPECIDLPRDAEPKSDGSYTNILDLH